MTKTEVGFIGVNAAELEWRDDTDVLKLPEGAQVKVLMRDSPRNLATLLGKFAPGLYRAGPRAPRHARGAGRVGQTDRR